jgi:hypothetical protein
MGGLIVLVCSAATFLPVLLLWLGVMHGCSFPVGVGSGNDLAARKWLKRHGGWCQIPSLSERRFCSQVSVLPLGVHTLTAAEVARLQSLHAAVVAEQARKHGPITAEPGSADESALGGLRAAGPVDAEWFLLAPLLPGDGDGSTQRDPLDWQAAKAASNGWQVCLGRRLG